MDRPSFWRQNHRTSCDVPSSQKSRLSAALSAASSDTCYTQSFFCSWHLLQSPIQDSINVFFPRCASQTADSEVSSISLTKTISLSSWALDDRQKSSRISESNSAEYIGDCDGCDFENAFREFIIITRNADETSQNREAQNDKNKN